MRRATTGHRQRRQPGAARGQLRPACARLGQELRPHAPASDGRVDGRLEDQRGAHGTPTTSARPSSPSSSPRHGSLRIELAGEDGTTTVLRESVPVMAGEIVDASVMRAAALREFLTAQVARAKAEGVLFSVHLKATMMKVSDPIIFGHAVRAFFPQTFAQYGDALAAAGLTPERRTGRDSQGPGARCPNGARDQGRLRRRAGRRARRWRWSTPNEASPTCTSRAT